MQPSDEYKDSFNDDLASKKYYDNAPHPECVRGKKTTTNNYSFTQKF